MQFVRATSRRRAAPTLAGGGRAGGGVGRGRLLVERRVGSDGVVVHAPRLDRGGRIGEADRPVLVQALVAKLAVETLDIGVLDRLAGTNEAQIDLAGVGPRVERPPGKLRPVTHV